jgi:hypothetical protein
LGLLEKKGEGGSEPEPDGDELLLLLLLLFVFITVFGVFWLDEEELVCIPGEY